MLNLRGEYQVKIRFKITSYRSITSTDEVVLESPLIATRYNLDKNMFDLFFSVV